MNCTRRNEPPSTSASVLTVSVLASPGTPSSSTWPPASSATSSRSSIASWPTITRLSSYSACLEAGARVVDFDLFGARQILGLSVAGAGAVEPPCSGASPRPRPSFSGQSSRSGRWRSGCAFWRRRRLLGALLVGESPRATAAGTPMASAPPAAAMDEDLSHGSRDWRRIRQIRISAVERCLDLPYLAWPSCGSWSPKTNPGSPPPSRAGCAARAWPSTSPPTAPPRSTRRASTPTTSWCSTATSPSCTATTSAAR